jgi:indolepyruvate ferredoxin oxidoreductase alpha subunit
MDLFDLHPGQETLLQGNQAIARGALEAGLSWASGYPGNPSSEILENLSESIHPGRLYMEWSVNEKVALEGAAAASFSGLRAMVTMKQNGVNVCMDSLTTLAQSGIRAGLVLVVADDPSGISSSNEEDSRFAAQAAHVPLFEPSSPQEALEMTRYALELSEQIGQICIVRSLSRISHARSNVIPGAIPDQSREADFDIHTMYHTFPVVGKHEGMYAKLAQVEDRFESSPFNTYSGPPNARLCVVACGTCVSYAQEVLEIMELQDTVGLLKIGTTHPLPKKFIQEHLAKAKEILIVEEIDPVLERNLKALMAGAGPDISNKRFYGKYSGHIPLAGEVTPGVLAGALSSITGRPNPLEADKYREKATELVKALVPAREFGFCPGCPHRASYWAIKNILAADDRAGFVSGDIGCYTMAIWPTGFHQIKSVHAMGSGVGLSSGFGKLGEFGFDQPVISVVGDSTFFHAAVPALINAVYNQSGFLLVVLDNSATAMTGFQPHPGTGKSATGRKIGRVSIEDVCSSLNIPVTIADPYDLAKTEAILLDELSRLDSVRVVVLRRKCALVAGREGRFKYQMRVDPDICRGASCGCNRYCNRVFRCPGLVFDSKTGAAMIDDVICVGCGVCEQICPAGAIIKETIGARKSAKRKAS